jgi:hypothetical protein
MGGIKNRLILIFFGTAVLAMILIAAYTHDAGAQAGVESARVRLYFIINNQPFRDPIKLFVSCYGRQAADGTIATAPAPGSYLPEVVYDAVVDCPDYGCRASLAYFTKDKYIEFCEFQAQAQGKNFLIGQSAGFIFQNCTEECPIYLEIPLNAGLSYSPLPLFLRQYLNSEQGRFTLALLLALLVEIPIVWVLGLMICDRETANLTRLVVITVLVTCVVLPVAWFIFPQALSPATAVLLGLVVAFFIEMISYRIIVPVRLSQAIILAFVANVAAFGLYLYWK